MSVMAKVKKFFSQLKKLFKNKYFLLIFSVLVIAGGVLIYLALAAPAKPTIETIIHPTTTTTKDNRITSKLMGIKVDPAVNDRKIVAVVVENHPGARPQSGLDKASIVYETIAEGGITRFLAFYQENEAAEIGPVRSARTYFVDWALEYDALFAHVGGNVDALDEIGPLGVQDINQFFNANYFWRDNSRYAPHNVYTTTDKLRAAGAGKYPATSDFKDLDFKSDAPLAERPQTASLTVHFSGYEYDPTYTYDRNTNTWLRSLAGAPFKDKVTGAQIAPKNVAVEFTSFSYGFTRYNESTTHIGTVGSGRALFYIDGQQVEGTWEKADRKSQTVFKDLAGNEIKFDPGQTWIEVIPDGNTVDFR